MNNTHVHLTILYHLTVNNIITSFFSYPGVLGIGRLAMQANSVIDHSDHFNFECSNIHMRYSSTITANRITVDAGEVHLEGEASFDVSSKYWIWIRYIYNLASRFVG